MRSLLSKTIYLCVFVFCSSCMSSSKKEMNQNTPTPQEKPKTAKSKITNKIPPNTCRIIGTVVEIDKKLAENDPGSPCSKVPCRAKIRIDSVIGYGSAFSPPLTKGGEIWITFAFTLSSTKELFPELTETYQGLKTNSQFKADIKQMMQKPKPGKSKKDRYTIYSYEVL